MALTLTYDDAHLAPPIAAQPTWETRALADVAQLGTFPDPWPATLAVLRAYVLCCLESLADEGDAFSAKLEQYQKEWAAGLQVARIAADAAASAPTRLCSLPIQRG